MSKVEASRQRAAEAAGVQPVGEEEVLAALLVLGEDPDAGRVTQIHAQLAHDLGAGERTVVVLEAVKQAREAAQEKLQQNGASLAGSTLQGPRRDPTQVSYFTPYLVGDLVQIGAADWQVKHDTPGWYLTNTGTWKGEHPTIRHISSMNELIHHIELAHLAARVERNPLETRNAVSFDEVASAVKARGYEIPAAGIEVMRNWANAGNLLGPIEGESLGEKIDAMLRVLPQQCSFLEFNGLSTIQRLHEGHDTSFVTFAGQALVTVDLAAYDGLREAHRVMVSRALWSHTPANTQAPEPLPHQAVLTDYPELRQKFPEQFAMAEKGGEPPAARIVTLPDGFNGHTRRFYAQPIEVDGNTVKLRCAEPGSEYLIAWRSAAEVQAAIDAQIDGRDLRQPSMTNGFALAGRRFKVDGLSLLSFHETQAEAVGAMGDSKDARNLFVVPAEVQYAANGNVRLWRTLGEPVAVREAASTEPVRSPDDAVEQMPPSPSFDM